MISAKAFTTAVGITPQAAREAFRVCSTGGQWRGESLPVHEVPSNRGGARGKVWVLHPDRCSPALRDLLGLTGTLPSTTIEERLKGRAEDWQIAIAADKYRILTPVLLTQPGSSERAQAIRDLAAQPAHQIGGTWPPVAERTLYDWLNAAEGNLCGLLPSGRSDRGVARVLMTRLWDAAIDLADGVKAEIAARITREAQSRAANDGTADREIIRL